jgi:hypothetical protein
MPTGVVPLWVDLNERGSLAALRKREVPTQRRNLHRLCNISASSPRPLKRLRPTGFPA